LPSPHRCRPQGWFPLDGSGCEHGRCELRRARPVPCRPWASRPCSMPLAFLELPFRAFPSRGAVPALAGLLSPLRVRARRPPARSGRALRPAFAAAPTLCHGSSWDSPDAWARTAVSRGARRTRRSCLGTPTAIRRSPVTSSPVSRRHARFGALLPPRVRSPFSLTLAGVGVIGSLLSWDFFPL